MIKTNLQTYWNGDDVKIRAKKAIYDSILQCATVVQSQAVLLCPVDMGNLRGSITIKLNNEKGILQTIKNSAAGDHIDGTEIDSPQGKNEAFVGTAVIYGPAVEFGIETKPNYPMQPYMRPAMDLAMGKTLSIVNEKGRNQFKEYLK